MQGGSGSNVDAPDWVETDHEEEAYRFLSREIEFYGGDHESPNWVFIKSLIEGMRRKERAEAWQRVEENLEYDRSPPTETNIENIVLESLENQLVAIENRGPNPMLTTPEDFEDYESPDVYEDADENADAADQDSDDLYGGLEEPETERGSETVTDNPATTSEADGSTAAEDDKESVPPEFREENQQDPDVVSLDDDDDDDGGWDKTSSHRNDEEDRIAGQAGLTDF